MKQHALCTDHEKLVIPQLIWLVLSLETVAEFCYGTGTLTN